MIISTDDRLYYDQGWNDRCKSDVMGNMTIGSFSYFTGWIDCDELEDDDAKRIPMEDPRKEVS